jgi:hypothetical protein
MNMKHCAPLLVLIILYCKATSAAPLDNTCFACTWLTELPLDEWTQQRNFSRT